MRYVTSVERLATERGMQQGMQKGMQLGEQKGKLEGETAVIARMISRRFGSLSTETRNRLDKATLEQLELWADRILDASSLEQLFQDN